MLPYTRPEHDAYPGRVYYNSRYVENILSKIPSRIEHFSEIRLRTRLHHRPGSPLQFKALEAAGCERFLHEKASGPRRDRPKLIAALDYLRESELRRVNADHGRGPDLDNGH